MKVKLELDLDLSPSENLEEVLACYFNTINTLDAGKDRVTSYKIIKDKTKEKTNNKAVASIVISND